VESISQDNITPAIALSAARVLRTLYTPPEYDIAPNILISRGEGELRRGFVDFRNVRVLKTGKWC
jgi:hypothetical protein